MYIKCMTKKQILDLIKNNDELKEGYECFVKNYGDCKIVDMYSNCHINMPLVEVSIKFYYGISLYMFEYYHNENDGEIKFEIYEIYKGE